MSAHAARCSNWQQSSTQCGTVHTDSTCASHGIPALRRVPLLGASQVHQVQLGTPDHRATGSSLARLYHHVQLQHGMRPGALLGVATTRWTIRLGVTRHGSHMTCGAVGPHVVVCCTTHLVVLGSADGAVFGPCVQQLQHLFHRRHTHLAQAAHIAAQAIKHTTWGEGNENRRAHGHAHCTYTCESPPRIGSACCPSLG